MLFLFFSQWASGRYPPNPAIWLVPGAGRIFLSLTTVTVTARKPLNENWKTAYLGWTQEFFLFMAQICEFFVNSQLKTLLYLQKASNRFNLCSLIAWRFVSLLLNSLYTAVLVYKLRSPECLLTPIFTLMTSFFSFFTSFIEVRYIIIQEIVHALTGILLFICRKWKAGAPFVLVKTEITQNDFAEWLNRLYPKNQHIRLQVQCKT